MRVRENLIGKKFTRLIVLSLSHVDRHRNAHWNCKCDCGVMKTISQISLKNNKTKSCGCYNLEMCVKRGKDRGRGKTPILVIWRSMIERCYNPKRDNYSYYGGRGISVCDEWKNDSWAFYDWAMANGYSKGLSIDRINNYGNYEPSNCRWVSIVEQKRNKRSNKLNMLMAIEIRKIYANKQATLTNLSRTYSVSKQVIWHVVNNKTWV